MTKELEDGFYWVRLREGDPWNVARCEDGMFDLLGSYEDWFQDDFDEINPRPIKREEL